VRQLRRGGTFLFFATVTWALSLTFVVSGQSQTAQTVWSGVYSEDQAYRGEKVADMSCIGCHGSGLSGGDSGPKLTGDEFLANWSSQPVSELFDWVRESMPADSPGTLSKEDAAAALAYIFKLNKMPAGKLPLSSDREALSRIEFTADKP
jgi:mono/diheme cytochrome c family protein